MCGIFGFTIHGGLPLTVRQAGWLTEALFRLSESRGKEAAGFAAAGEDVLTVFRSPHTASRMLRTSEYRDAQAFALRPSAGAASHLVAPFGLIGHCRLETTGTHYENRNNQPVARSRAAGIHNGILVNDDALWARHPAETRHSDLDTEALFMTLDAALARHGDVIQAVRDTFALIEGMASVAALLTTHDVLLLATNNGSLYRAVDRDNRLLAFASESFILRQLARKCAVPPALRAAEIRHLPAGQGCCVDLATGVLQDFPLRPDSDRPAPRVARAVPRSWHMAEPSPHTGLSAPAPSSASRDVMQAVGHTLSANVALRDRLKRIEERFPHHTDWADSLRRCTRCILPETMPFIEFDAAGVCSYCRNYRPLQYTGEDALRALADRHRRRDGRPDCVIGVSGGRDSLYSLHYVRNVLDLHPVAYTYDWGMVTDLARRNISRICARLGVEHTVVSADIVKKRAFIRQNLAAWLQRPAIGMVPLFMAGDKYFYYHLHRVRRQVGVELEILGENMLERTDFKTGFAGVRPYNVDPKHVYTLSVAGRIALAAYYAGQYLRQPAYLNASLLDTVGAYASYYLQQLDFVNLYTYIPWREEVIVPVIRERYDFELSPDSTTTWRIGDGTAAFYNYVYYHMAGFTENDTFRSNQIREGLIDRATALARVREENQPRFETIYWYLNIVQLDTPIETVLDVIRRIPRLPT
jgi:hypothetical protein